MCVKRDKVDFLTQQHLLGFLTIVAGPALSTSPPQCTAVHNAQIEQFKFLRVVCAWTYLKKSLNIFDITYIYPDANNPEKKRENSIFVNLNLGIHRARLKMSP